MSNSLRDQLMGLGFTPAPKPERPERPSQGKPDGKPGQRGPGKPHGGKPGGHAAGANKGGEQRKGDQRRGDARRGDAPRGAGRREGGPGPGARGPLLCRLAVADKGARLRGGARRTQQSDQQDREHAGEHASAHQQGQMPEVGNPGGLDAGGFQGVYRRHGQSGCRRQQQKQRGGANDEARLRDGQGRDPPGPVSWGPQRIISQGAAAVAAFPDG